AFPLAKSRRQGPMRIVGTGPPPRKIDLFVFRCPTPIIAAGAGLPTPSLFAGHAALPGSPGLWLASPKHRLTALGSFAIRTSGRDRGQSRNPAELACDRNGGQERHGKLVLQQFANLAKLDHGAGSGRARTGAQPGTGRAAPS